MFRRSVASLLLTLPLLIWLRTISTFSCFTSVNLTLVDLVVMGFNVEFLRCACDKVQPWTARQNAASQGFSREIRFFLENNILSGMGAQKSITESCYIILNQIVSSRNLFRSIKIDVFFTI